jgi:hypothetical protein
MRKLTSVYFLAVLMVVFGSGLSLAQSNGNFSATGIGAACVISQADGTFGSAACATPAPGSSAQCGMLQSTISMSGASGNTLLIRPSLVTGLYTNTNLLSTNKNSSGITVATADIGIQVCVDVDGSQAGIKPSGCVTYDERFQQLSTNLFSTLATNCTTLPSAGAAACCTAGPGGTNTCTPGTPDALTCTACNLDLVQSTLAAHSFDFAVPQTAFSDGKSHTVHAIWNVVNGSATGATPGGSVMACTGPGIVTLTQTKVFNNSGSLSF